MESEAKVAIVTGARRGIGRAAAYELAHSGYDLVLNDRESDEAVEETLRGVAALGRTAEFVQSDISDLRSHEHIVNRAYDVFGHLDALVNNAGVQVRIRGDLLDVTPERFDDVMDINLRGNFFLTQTAAKRMLSDGHPTKGRSIVTITSANAALVSVSKGEYCISKCGLSMATKLFAVRLAEAGILVFEVRPGFVRTDMTADVRERYGAMIDDGLQPIRRWGEPEEIGRVVTTLITGMIPFTTGISIDVDGGLMVPRL